MGRLISVGRKVSFSAHPAVLYMYACCIYPVLSSVCSCVFCMSNNRIKMHERGSCAPWAWGAYS
jgi:hypothetical protein